MTTFIGIQYLRGFAALAVAIFHLAMGLVPEQYLTGFGHK